MRRLTVTTISGIMIAILLGVGFALFGFFAPTSGNAWRDPGAIIVENDTGASYVLLATRLHPVLNYPSAVLAVGHKQSPHVVHVDRSELNGVRRGPTIGIDGLPESLPGARRSASARRGRCARRCIRCPGGRLAVRVSLLAGSNGAARPVPSVPRESLVRTPSSSTRYLLSADERLALASSPGRHRTRPARTRPR